MAKRAYLAQYYADDKDLYDLVESAPRTMSARRLVELARERGIFLCEGDDRDELVDYVTRLPFDWPQLSRLLSMADTPDRAERQASSLIISGADQETLRAAVVEAKNDRETDRGEIFAVTPVGTGIMVEVQYTELDTSRTRVNQRRQKKLTIAFEKTATGDWRARHEANQRAEEIVEDVIRMLTPTGQPLVERRSIELSGIRDATARTEFFIRLMSSMTGFKMLEVRTINVDRMPVAGEEQDDESDEEAEEEIEDGEKPAPKPEDAAMLATVNSVLLKGTDLLKSDEYQRLRSKGLFISHAIWRTQELKKDGLIYDFEAEFVDGPNARKFRYGPRAMFQRKKNGDFKKAHEQVREGDKPILNQMIECAAQAALEVVSAAHLTPAPTAPGAEPEDG